MKKFYLFFAFIFLMNASIFAQAEPANQPTGFNSSSLRAYQVRVFYQTAGNGVRYLVLRDTSPITDVPTDNVAYTLGNSLGDAKVVGLNTNTSNTMRGLNANTTYYFAVFAYNESGGNQNYKTDNPLTGEITTLGLEPDNYYVGLDAESNGFIDDLSDVLSAHSHQLYGNFDETVIVNIHEKDTMGETGILCEYSNELQTYTGTFNFTDDNYTREHMLPRSWMPSDAETSDIEGADYHNLALVRDFVNTERLNYPMGEVTNPNWTYEEASGNDNVPLFEPREEYKGDVARAMFYMVVCYDGKGGSWAFDDLQTWGSDQNVALLKQWHEDDPVSAFEIAKHEYIAQIQGSRNPFVDNPQWVDCIDFTDLTIENGCDFDTTYLSPSVGIKDVYADADQLTVLPNPVKDVLFFELDNNETIEDVALFSMDGKIVKAASHVVNMDVSDLNRGIYLLSVKTKKSIYTQKVVVE